MFSKVGSWITDRSDRFIRGEAGAPGSYYGSSEAEQVYGQMGHEPQEEMDDTQEIAGETSRRNTFDSFDRAGKDYGGRVPYRSQRDMQQQQMALETERQRQLRAEQTRAYAPAPNQPPQPPYSQNPQVGVQGYGQAPGGYAPPPNAALRQQPAAGPGSNVVVFPGLQQTPEGGACTHMEYIVLLRNRNECTKVIEYIKSHASVFLNMEFIASDGERQRCVDMLSGAAYTLGCAFNKISPRGIYLISAPSVYVVIDPALQKYTSAPEAQGFVRQNYESGYGSPHRSGAPQAGRYDAQSQEYPRKGHTSFGSAMTGNATGAYPSSGYQSSGSVAGRYPKKDYQ